MNKDFYIDTEDKFNEFIKKAKQQNAIALDTEFLWRRTYYPVLGLIQAAFSRDECYLIDTIAIKDISAFSEILTDKNIVKILHDAIQDLQIISKACNDVIPVNIFDTRRAAGFASLDPTISLAKLIEKLFDVLLPKSETNTDWTARPLTENQKEYAIDDVIYMCEMREKIINKATQNGFNEWLNAEMEIYEDAKIYENILPNERFLKVKGINKLSPEQMRVAKGLAEWRDIQAEKRDIPKTFVFKDSVLLQIIYKNPQTMQDVQRIKDIHPATVRKFGSGILKVVQKSTDSDENMKWVQKKLKSNHKNNDALKDMKTFIAEKAEELGIAPELLATRSELNQLLDDRKNNNLDKNPLLQTWRKEIFSEIVKL